MKARLRRPSGCPLIAATALFIAGCLWPVPGELHAGLTGENVVVVVNGDSTDSLTIANHYAALRHIPSQNIIVLDDVPSGLKVSLDEFRNAILKPVLETINARRIAPQISVVAYSAGFPTSVDITSLAKRFDGSEQSKYRTPTASINSLTYFYRWVLSDSPDCLAWGANLYARGPFDRHFANPFAGEKGEQFQSAVDADAAERFDEAAETFETLADQFPTLYPLHILAAESWLRSGEEDRAFSQVREAVASGWSNRRYLTETEPLSRLFEPDGSERATGYRRLLDRLQDVPRVMQGPVAFSALKGWTGNGHAAAHNEGGMPYMLSCMLAVIHKNGSTLAQAVDSLGHAATADRTYPDATFGFSKNNDVRTTTRFPVTPDAIAWLLARDQKVEIFPSALPADSKPYIGMMLGAATLPLNKRKWTFAPGAIAENLTSFGAVFDNASQTKLTALLDAGAAISSGTVTEPYALSPKFPTAMMYPYYGEGVTAIEAFYLTVHSPYQLLIVGDPLCQPFAKAPNDFVRIDSAASSPSRPPANATAEPVDGAAGEPVTKTHDGNSEPSAPHAMEIAWQSLPDTPVSVPTAAMELYLHGKLVQRIRPVASIRINLPPDTLGVVDARVVLIGNHPTRPTVVFHEDLVMGEESSLPRIEKIADGNPGELKLSIACDDAEHIDITHLSRVVATLDNALGEITLTPDQVGRGPIRLQAIAKKSGRVILGRCVELDW